MEETCGCGAAVTINFLTAEETGAEHCQHDTPTIAEEYRLDWLADGFGIDERAILSLAS